MLKRAAARSKATLSSVVENNNATTATTTSNTKKQVFTSPKSVFHATDPNSIIPSDEVIERVRLKITNAHIFKLPPKPDSGGWRGAGKFMIFSVHVQWSLQPICTNKSMFDSLSSSFQTGEIKYGKAL